MLYQAVTGWTSLQSKGIRAGLPPRPPQRVPRTPIHAAEPGATETLCGLDGVEVTDKPWPVGMGGCVDCSARAKALA